MNYYEILELSPDCTSTQIRTQYRKFAKVYHPDKNKGRNTHTEKFHQIQEAYDTLVDYELRKEYDRLFIYGTQGTTKERELIPFVNYFRCESTTFIVGGLITFNWQVSGADDIEIKPFGKVDSKKGSKTVKIKTYVEVLQINLVAKNSKTGEFISERITLKGLKVEDSQTIGDSSLDKKEKVPLWGWFVNFAIIMIAVFSIFGLGIKAVSFLTGNDYYVSDTFFMSAVPYVSIAGFIWFLYAIFEENN